MLLGEVNTLKSQRNTTGARNQVHDQGIVVGKRFEEFDGADEAEGLAGNNNDKCATRHTNFLLRQ
jgi:hypothetical protein